MSGKIKVEHLYHIKYPVQGLARPQGSSVQYMRWVSHHIRTYVEQVLIATRTAFVFAALDLNVHMRKTAASSSTLTFGRAETTEAASTTQQQQQQQQKLPLSAILVLLLLYAYVRHLAGALHFKSCLALDPGARHIVRDGLAPPCRY